MYKVAVHEGMQHMHKKMKVNFTEHLFYTRDVHLCTVISLTVLRGVFALMIVTALNHLLSSQDKYSTVDV